MRNTPNLPTTDNPVVGNGEEKRSMYLPGHFTNEQLREMNDLEVGSFALAAVTVVARGDHDGACELYWSQDQTLYLKDGRKVANGLAQAARIAEKLQWSNGSSMLWKNVDSPTFQEDVFEASRTLGFL
ncbi:MAG: hypothetical protein HLX46_07345 [Corynebacterium sp.]|uniref:hypothetical protein n=1 Tax=Corynebacterium sp. TaxID=1720 RepID=UPI001794E291|nr:hypothetical protein [Corynebacterium sp.]NWO16640.1 hypothetical protein [Corynebacterium sp.]